MNIKKSLRILRVILPICIDTFKANAVINSLKLCIRKINLTIIFILAVEMYIQTSTSFFVPFDRAALALTNSTVINFDAEDNNGTIHSGLRWRELQNFNHPDAPVLLTIEQSTFDHHYGGISPIDRCKFADAINPILATNPKVLFIDYDLSPLQIDRSEQQIMQDGENNTIITQYPQHQFKICQEKLNQTLFKYGEKIILIEPFSDSQDILSWKKNLEQHGVKFASAKMNSSLGMVVTTSTHPNSVAKVINDKITQCGLAQCTEDIMTTSPINFAGLGKFEDIDSENTTFDPNKVIFIGGTYGIDDHHITPIGENTPGIMIQAYDYASSLKPFSNAYWVQILTFLFELIFATLILNILQKLWQWYINYETSENPVKVQLAVFVSIIIYIISGLLAWISLYIAGWLLRGDPFGIQIWISPVPIILAIFVYSAKEILFKKLKFALQSQSERNLQDCSISTSEKSKFSAKTIAWARAINYIKIILGIMLLILIYTK
ncbi:MAG: CHASE2 domain-containing protein [Sulfuricurvum sp.]|nr:CHASE2 domain-containing protein [Sulfuricurvum sp.]